MSLQESLEVSRSIQEFPRVSRGLLTYSEIIRSLKRDYMKLQKAQRVSIMFYKSLNECPISFISLILLNESFEEPYWVSMSH